MTAPEPPYPGAGPWRCPVCERPTVKIYRCTNDGCEANLAGANPERIDVPGRIQARYPERREREEVAEV